jgi:hypothetical protein
MKYGTESGVGLPIGMGRLVPGSDSPITQKTSTLSTPLHVSQAVQAAVGFLRKHHRAGTMQFACIPMIRRGSMIANPEAVLFWLAFVGAGGLRFDPARWHVQRRPVDILSSAVEIALLNGESSSFAAEVFLSDGRAQGLRRNINNPPISKDANFVEWVYTFFQREMMRAQLGAQVARGLASWTELESVDAIGS